jgi:imidazolonepropionase-like amidohydrolase
VLADVLIDNADLVATCAGSGPRRGSAQREISTIPNASIAGFEGRIVFVGSAHDAAAVVTLTPQAQVINAEGCTVVPGFVDPHTHLVFAGDRRDELRRRLAGASYAEIAASGGGIVKTVDATRFASEHDLIDARDHVGVQAREATLPAGRGDDRINIAVGRQGRQAAQIDQSARFRLQLAFPDQLFSKRRSFIERGPLASDGDAQESGRVRCVGGEGHSF